MGDMSTLFLIFFKKIYTKMKLIFCANCRYRKNKAKILHFFPLFSHFFPKKMCYAYNVNSFYNRPSDSDQASTVPTGWLFLEDSMKDDIQDIIAKLEKLQKQTYGKGNILIGYYIEQAKVNAKLAKKTLEEET